MRVIVTGHEGYLGSVLVPLLSAAGHEVTGIDTGWFTPCLLGPPPPEVRPSGWTCGTCGPSTAGAPTRSFTWPR